MTSVDLIERSDAVSAARRVAGGVLPSILMAAPVAYTRSLRHLAQALHEADALRALYTVGAVRPDSLWTGSFQAILRVVAPQVRARLQRRAVDGVPAHLVHNQHGWEVARQVASRVGASPLVLDRLWLRTVMRLDATCARLIAEQRFQAFVGLEHASLMTLRAGSLTGKPTVLVCASPHHSARRRWVDSEFAAFPALKNRTTDALLERQRVADDRRDQELRLAEVVLTNSRLTTQSIVDAGVPGEKIVTLPLGIVPALNSVDERPLGDGVIRFVFAGTVAPHKGIHYLLEAWARLRAGRAAELHVFGKSLVSAKMLGIHSGVTMHGAVPYANLRRAYLGASVFVLPTLYDGYGEVIGEALAHGVPVVTTLRAGAADLIRDGVNGFIVPPADARALADRMDWCLRHPREIEAMRPRALETARQWTWEAYRRALREVLAARLAA